MITSVYYAFVQDAVLMRKMLFFITMKRFTYLVMKICNAIVVIHGPNITNKIKKYLRVIDIDTASRLNLQPGQKLCKHCLEHAHKISSSSDEDINEYGMKGDLETSFMMLLLIEVN